MISNPCDAKAHLALTVLVAADKTGSSEAAFYKKLIARADTRYKQHLQAIGTVRNTMPAGQNTAQGKETMKTLQEKLSALPAVRRQKIANRTAELVAQEMTLRELRKTRQITQTQLAKALGVNQEQISRKEARADIHLSSLKKSIEAMGGELIVLVQFPDAKPIKIIGLAEL